jgi:large subunit ribosomal protein L15
MVVRRSRKREKLRGQRTHGHGNTKNRRGGGSRGGRGQAGSHKHKFNQFFDFFGSERKRIKPKQETKAINLGQLVQQLPKLAELKKVEKRGNSFVIDGQKIGFDKILSMGIVQEKLVVKNMRVSKKAREKILKAGGKIEEWETGAKGKEAKKGETGKEKEAPAAMEEDEEELEFEEAETEEGEQQ